MVDVLQNWLTWFHFLFLEVGLLVILINCMIFLSSFLDVTRMSMSSFFPLIYDLSGFTSRINRHLVNRFPICCNLFVLLFLVTPFLVVAVRPCMELITIKNKKGLVVETSLGLIYILPCYFYLVHVIHYFYLTNINLPVIPYPNKFMINKENHFSGVICVWVV